MTTVPQLSTGQFFGNTCRTREVRGFTLTETTYSSGGRIPLHSHQQPYFCFVLQGRFAEFSGHRISMCQPTTMIFHPSGESHSDHFSTDAHCLNLQVTAQFDRESVCLQEPAKFQGGTPAYLAGKLYREFRDMDDISELAIEGLALELIVETLRSGRRRQHKAPPWLTRAKDMLHDRFAERHPRRIKKRVAGDGRTRPKYPKRNN